jgi:sulfur-oxidizing protein SoxY
MHRFMVRIAAIALNFGIFLPVLTANAAPLPADPLKSPVWDGLGALLFEGAPVRFDPRVKIDFPEIAENQRSFPVAVDARALTGVRRIILFADLNPIQQAIDFTPQAAAPFIATRIKLDQRTPVRAAVLLSDGSWHVNGRWIDAAGGGCSAPPLSRVNGDWAAHLGEVRGLAVRGAAGTRVRLAFRHPMDTGMVGNIAAYTINRLTLTGPKGEAFGTLSIEGSVAEDPSFSLLIPPAVTDTLHFAARDTNGRDYRGLVPIRAENTAVAAR